MPRECGREWTQLRRNCGGAIEVTVAELLSTEYVVCLAERRSLRIVSAFLELVEEAARL